MVVPEWEPAREANAERVWREFLRPLAEGLRDDARELSEATVAYIRPHLPELFPDPESIEENRASTEASIRGLAEMLIEGADPRTVELPVATAAYAQSGVRRGIPFPSMIRSYRLGHQAVTDVINGRLTELVDDPESLPTAIRLCSNWLFSYVDTALLAAERTYDEERERWLRSTAASKAETVTAILEGHQRDPELASRRLGYRLDRRHHVGAIAWLEATQEGVNPLPSLEGAVEELGESIGAEGTLAHPLGMLAVAAWFGFSSEPGPDGLEAAKFDRAAAPGVRVSLGEPGDGLTGFERSHAEAIEARRVASLAGRPAGTITPYGRVTLSALATANLRAARDFVERELGPLAGDDDVSRRLSETLRAYLDEQASRSRAAKRLDIHENTVSYRVRQAEDLLGRKVDERTLELRVALELANVVREAPDDA